MTNRIPVLSISVAVLRRFLLVLALVLLPVLLPIPVPFPHLSLPLPRFLDSTARADDAVPPGPTRTYVTRRAETPPRIDGDLSDAVWSTVDWASDFIQREPAEGKPPSNQTAFKILYDDRNVYLAYRAYDSAPDKIARILARRDWFPGDWVEVNIDSYHDHRTAFSFTASVSGTQGDEFVSEDGDNWDSSWDPVWEHKTRIDADGWTAEVRIPLSQLRYPDQPEQVWGIQVQRRVHRLEERSTWQPIPKDASGWVSRFGDLKGISGIRPLRRVELLPYVVTREERFEKIEGDPFADGSRGKIAGGLDGKVGVSGNMTLDFTVNPDFGQVEADPSQVNLTAFETFFTEKRPFFIEGSNILDFRVAPSVAYGTHTRDQVFYSRRLGRAPHYRADQNEDGYVDQPENTSILGAFKLTGKTAGGLSIGALDCVTDRERAEVDLGGARHRVTVEPQTNYFVGRLQQDFRRGDTRIGGMFTSVHRKIDDPVMESLRDAAYTGALDLYHYLAGRSYYVALNLLGSRVEGSREAILATQMSPAHYYQRPDNRGQSVDSTRTSLSGHGGSLRLGRPEGSLRFETGAAWRSPGFEMNDIGFLRNADEINQFTWVGYGIRNPFSIFRRMELNTNQWLDFEYGGENLYQAFNFNTNASFRNNWSYNLSISRENDRISNYELRGGPSFRLPGDVSMDGGFDSDSRRELSFGAGGGGGWTDDKAGGWKNVNAYTAWRPTNALRIEVNPSYNLNRPHLQYLATTALGDDPRFLFGSLDQKTFNLSFRIDYSMTPNLTVQYYGSPFISAGTYSDFKRVTKPRAARLQDRFTSLAGAARYDASEDAYGVDEDGDSIADYSFSDPDFNVRDFNSNLVLRWQYAAGSSLYLVWSQARSGYVPVGRFSLRDDLDGLFGVHPRDVFLVKVNRWFNL